MDGGRLGAEGESEADEKLQGWQIIDFKEEWKVKEVIERSYGGRSKG